MTRLPAFWAALVLLAATPVWAQGAGLARIAAADPVLKIALDLIRIPSPSGHEEKIAGFILERLRALGAEARRDGYGNVVARLPATPGFENVPPLLLAAHMDMVPGDKKNPLKPIRPRVVSIEGKEWIAGDGTTTLGGDDKAGVAAIIDTIARLTGKRGGRPVVHGPIEAVITREEETTVRGAVRLDTSKLRARHALLLDGERLFEVVWELAGATEVIVRARGARGGHSGVDIHRPDNINAIKVISEIDARIPQGVVERNARGIVTSINAGLAEGGTAKNAIASEAQIAYFVRTTDPASEKKLIDEIGRIAAGAERKYRLLQNKFRVEVEVKPLLPPWAARTGSPLLALVQLAGERLGEKNILPLSIHAGAEANIYAHKKNARGRTLEPLLLGVANLHAIHSTRERMDWRSLIRGRDWVVEIVRLLAERGRL